MPAPASIHGALLLSVRSRGRGAAAAGERRDGGTPARLSRTAEELGQHISAESAAATSAAAAATTSAPDTSTFLRALFRCSTSVFTCPWHHDGILL